MESLLDRETIPDRAKLYFTGRLVQQARNAEGLESILEDYFDTKTELESFFGRWLDLPEDSLCQLGASRATGALGSTIIVGSRVWTAQMHVRLRLGPMPLAQFQLFLPGGRSFPRLKDWLRQYLGQQFSWDLQLVLAKEEVPQTQLGRAGRLGWTTWLGTRAFLQDADDLVLTPSANLN